MAGGGAVGDHRHRQAGGGVGRIVHDLDVEHGGQAAQALGADAERVDLVHSSRRSSSAVVRAEAFQLVDVDRAPSATPWPAASPSPAVPPMPMPRMPGGHQPRPWSARS